MSLVCKTCGETKLEAGFYKHKLTKSGYTSECKECIKLKARVYASKPENKKRKASYDAVRFQENKKSIYAYRKTAVHEIAYSREWSRTRKQSVKDRTPSWADRESIRDTYKWAIKMRDITGVDYEVDHIIPLHGKNVCGLHVEGNLQVLEKSLNRAKSNHFELPESKYPK